MTDLLTIEEIKSRYAPNWVLIVDIESDEVQRIRKGRVVFDSPDRDEVWSKADELCPRPRHLSVRYLGEWPADMEFIL